MACTKKQLNAWRMEILQETFSCKTTFFKIDQLIAENPKSSKQAFDLFHVTIISIASSWVRSQIKSIADQDCLALYVGTDFTEYQWRRRCRKMIGEKPKRPDCILCVFNSYSASKKILVHHIINRALSNYRKRPINLTKE